MVMKLFLSLVGRQCTEVPVRPAAVAEIIALIDEGKISHAAATQRIFPELLQGRNASPTQLAKELNLIQERNEDTIQPIIDQVIREFPLKVEEFKNGKKGIVTMFMGEVMKRTKGKADPKLANELLTRKLKTL